MNNKGSAMIVISVLVAIILIGGSLVFKFWLGPAIFFKQVDSAHEIVDKTYDVDNALYNYEWFKTQHEKINRNPYMCHYSVYFFNQLWDIFKNRRRASTTDS